MNKIQAKKHLGQHFLVHTPIIHQIIHAIAPSEHDQIVEIGPGLGALTFPLLQKVQQLIAIEMDPRCIQQLEEQVNQFGTQLGTLTLHHQDALTFHFSTLTDQTHCLRLVGNLPYMISTPLLFHLMNQITWIKDMHFMLQKEVADRITAQPCHKQYGRLSVMIQYYCQTQKLFNVPPQAFSPKPKVDSSVIRLTPYSRPPYPAQNFEIFSAFVKEAFNHRRKIITYALKKFTPNTTSPLETLNLSPKIRPESLTVKDFVNISNLLIK